MSNYREKLDGVRTKLGELYERFEAFVPNRKVVAGFIGAGIVAGLQNVLPGFNLPDGYAEILAYALVAYLTPEPPEPVFIPEFPLPPAETGFGVAQSDVPPAFNPDVPAVEEPILDDDQRGIV